MTNWNQTMPQALIRKGERLHHYVSPFLQTYNQETQNEQRYYRRELEATVR